MLVSVLFVEAEAGAFFGFSSSDDDSEDSDDDSELESSLLSSVSDLSFVFFLVSCFGFGAGLVFVSTILASTETRSSDLTFFEASTFFGASSSSSDSELEPEPELPLLLLL